MLEKYDRPFTNEERVSLDARLVPVLPDRRVMLQWLSLWLAILLVGVAIIICISSFLDRQPIWVVVIGSVFLGLVGLVCIVASYCAYAAVAGHRRTVYNVDRFTRESTPLIRAALQDGRATVCRVTAAIVIVIEEFEDEQSAFIFDLGDGTSFYLRGEEYYLDDAPDDLRPPRKFEIVRASANGLWLGVFNREGRLEPELEVSMDEMPPEYVWGNSPTPESVLPGSPAEVLSRLGYKGEARPNPRPLS